MEKYKTFNLREVTNDYPELKSYMSSRLNKEDTLVIVEKVEQWLQEKHHCTFIQFIVDSGGPTIIIARKLHTIL